MMVRAKKENDIESEATKRMYVSGLAEFDYEGVLVEQFFRGDGSSSATLKSLVIKGLDETVEQRTRYVKIYALLNGCTYEQAWVRIVSGRAVKFSLSDLTDEEFTKIDAILGKQTMYEINNPEKSR